MKNSNKNLPQTQNKHTSKIALGLLLSVLLFAIFYLLVQLRTWNHRQEIFLKLANNNQKMENKLVFELDTENQNLVRVSVGPSIRSLTSLDRFAFESPSNYRQPDFSRRKDMSQTLNKPAISQPMLPSKINHPQYFSTFERNRNYEYPTNLISTTIANEGPSQSKQLFVSQTFGPASFSFQTRRDKNKDDNRMHSANSNSNNSNSNLNNNMDHADPDQHHSSTILTASINSSPAFNDAIPLKTVPYQYPDQLTYRSGITLQQVKLARSLLNAKNQPESIRVTEIERKYYEEKYNISLYAEQPFCIVVPTYNNVQEDRYIHNLNSILQQNYSNYRIVLIDDASEDGTGEKLKQFAKQHQISQNKLKIVINKERKMTMPNLYTSAKEFCKPYEIFMIVDGDDEIIGRQVLKFFNSQFQSKNYWLIYSNFITKSANIGYSRAYPQSIIRRNEFRRAGFVISHLRAFYTKLFTLIKEEDLKDQHGNWFRAANDVAMYMPILEMTHQRHAYIPEICYMYNSNTGLNNHRIKLHEQKRNEKKVKTKAPYATLDELFTEGQKQGLKESLNRRIAIKDCALPLF